MFAPTYHLRPVKGDVVALAPTAKTWMQYAVLPNLVFVGLLVGFSVAANAAEKRQDKRNKTNPNLPDN